MLSVLRMTNRYIPTAGNLAVQAIWYAFFSKIIILHQYGLYGGTGNPQETTVSYSCKSASTMWLIYTCILFR
jgi:hypothetical protein